MMRTFVCQGCWQEKPSNPRLKGAQKFCNNPECQRVRKRRWQKEKMACDAVYRSQQLELLQAWRKKYPLHCYQKNYRLTHPKYVEHNRQQQRIRYQNHAMIVKMDTLNRIETDTYVLTRYEPEKIVKMDALLVELTVLNKFPTFKVAAVP